MNGRIACAKAEVEAETAWPSLSLLDSSLAWTRAIHALSQGDRGGDQTLAAKRFAPSRSTSLEITGGRICRPSKGGKNRHGLCAPMQFRGRLPGAAGSPLKLGAADSRFDCFSNQASSTLSGKRKKTSKVALAPAASNLSIIRHRAMDQCSRKFSGSIPQARSTAASAVLSPYQRIWGFALAAHVSIAMSAVSRIAARVIGSEPDAAGIGINALAR